jgi:hypothetical protein
LGETTHSAVEVLIQHIALRVPERAEFRSKASSAVVDLIRGLPSAFSKRVVHWLFRWAHNEKVAHRQFALEVMGRLLLEDEEEEEQGRSLTNSSSCYAPWSSLFLYKLGVLCF